MKKSVIRAPWAEANELLTEYYDTEWGLPVFDERGVFERLTLESFQAGLSWLVVLRKRPALRKAFAEFNPDLVAEFDSERIEELLGDASIIRNRAKIEAAVSNARATRELRTSGTHLGELVWSYMPERSPVPRTQEEVPSTSHESAALAQRLKSHGFRFVGPTTAYALMCALGIVDVHLATSHRRGCSGLWNPDGTRATGKVSPGKMVEFIRPLLMEQNV